MFETWRRIRRAVRGARILLGISHRLPEMLESVQSLKRHSVDMEIRSLEAEFQIKELVRKLEDLAQSHLNFSCNEVPQILELKSEQIQSVIRVGEERAADFRRMVDEKVASALTSIDQTKGVLEVVDAKFEVAIASAMKALEETLENKLREALEASRRTSNFAGAIDRKIDESLIARFAQLEPRTLDSRISTEVDAAIVSAVHNVGEIVERNIGAALEPGERSVAAFNSNREVINRDLLVHSRLATEWVREEWRYLRPMRPRGKEFVRIGRKGDGGYVMVDDLTELKVAISIGVGTEISWDLELAERGIKLFLFDNTIDALPAFHPNISFRRVGLSPRKTDNPTFATLAEIIASIELLDPHDAILKIDVEGAEWSVLAGLDPELLGSFTQILIELHGLSDYSDHDQHLLRVYALRNLAMKHQAVHLHPNNWGAYNVVGGIPIPDVIEVTWLRRDCCAFSEISSDLLGRKLDHPNNADRAEFEIDISALCNGRVVEKT